MAKIDEIKESIGYLKVVFSILIAFNVSFVAWIYRNYEKFNFFDLLMFMLFSFLVAIAVIYINRVILRKIKSLGDL